MVDVAAGLKEVRDKIIAASARRAPELRYFKPRLVAVSKLNSIEFILAAYEAGQRHFGENYVNELVEKSTNPITLERCKEIQWHFIGHLQRNKVNKVLSVPNLHFVETVDNERIASALDNSWPKFRKSNDTKLKVMVQVNTSKEEEKNGCDMGQVSTLFKYVVESCKNLELVGLMTIGKYGYDVSQGPNPDFLSLKKCREDVCKELNIEMEKIEMSMGMTTDYEHAVELGSTNVRVGTAIFGSRPTKNS